MKSFFIAMATCLASLTANAQMKLGPVLGLNLSNWTKDIYNNSEKAGAHFGAVVSIQMDKHILLETGVQYSMKGITTENSHYDEGKLNTDYIEIPVNLRYAFSEEGSGFHIGIGPYLGILMSARMIENGNERNVTDDYHQIDLGINLGMGYQLKNGFGIVATYGLGLTNIIKSKFIESEAQNTNIQFSLRYLFSR